MPRRVKGGASPALPCREPALPCLEAERAVLVGLVESPLADRNAVYGAFASPVEGCIEHGEKSLDILVREAADLPREAVGEQRLARCGASGVDLAPRLRQIREPREFVRLVPNDVEVVN